MSDTKTRKMPRVVRFALWLSEPTYMPRWMNILLWGCAWSLTFQFIRELIS